jgi:hypothetical protein
MKRIALALALSLTLLTAQAREVPLVEMGRVVLTTASGQDAVRAAIVAGGASHGWVVTQEEPGKLTLKYNKQGKLEVVLDVLFDAKGYEIKYVDSKNLNYAKTAEGTMIHPTYNRWVANLVKAIGQVAAAAH